MRIDRFLYLKNNASIPHAIIIESDDIGRREDYSRSLVAALMCNDPLDNKACMRCASCRKIEAGYHPDLIEIAPEKDIISIGDIQKIMDAIRLRPLEADIRCISIFNAHLMNIEAANKLLKALEEPPPNNIFFLITPSKKALLPTIASRCVAIRPIEEKGSIYDIEEGDGDDIPVRIASMTAHEDKGIYELLMILKGMYRQEMRPEAVSRLLSLIRRHINKKEDFIALLYLLSALVRDLLFVKFFIDNGDNRDNISSSVKKYLLIPEYYDFLKKICKYFSTGELYNYLFLLLSAESKTRYGGNTEYLFLNYAMFWLREEIEKMELI